MALRAFMVRSGVTEPSVDNASAPSASPSTSHDRDDARSLSGRVLGAFRYALPALLGYIGVRAAGLIVFGIWARQRGDSILGHLYSWDSYRYGDIAMWGYGRTVVGANGVVIGHSHLAFFPLYPLLIKFGMFFTGSSPRPAAIAVAWIASIAAAWGIFKVGDQLYGRRVGIFAAIAWGLLPNAIIAQMAYSESLFTALAAWSLYHVLRRNWIAAATLSVLAGLTRPTGIAVAAAVCVGAFIELVRHYRGSPSDTDDRQFPWRPVVAIVIAPAGWLGYFTYVSMRLKSLNGYFAVQHAWSSDFDPHLRFFGWMNHLLLRASPIPLNFGTVIIVVMGAIVLLILSILQRQPLPLITYSVVLLVIALGDHRAIWCEPRFLLPAFPLLLPIARALAGARQKSTAYVMVGVGIVISSVLSASFILLDVIGGRAYFP